MSESMSSRVLARAYLSLRDAPTSWHLGGVRPMATAVLDIDGTLVDTNYHHAIAWFRAFTHHGLVLPIWRIHRHIGMGGDQLVTALCGEEVEARLGDDIRDTEGDEYAQLIGEVRTMEGSRELIVSLKDRGHVVVLASSAKEDEVEAYLDLLDAREIADSWTTSADVESTKPAPDLVHAAMASVDSDPVDTVMVGDTPWDVKAAGRADVRTLAVVTGGFSEAELREAGAAAVYESVADLQRPPRRDPAAMTDRSQEAEQDRDESAPERLDRNTVELLNELRIAGTGIQVMFAFLLIVPFNTGWKQVDGFERTVYFVTLLVVAMSAFLLMAPPIHHRLLFRHGEKPFLIRVGNYMAIGGMACLGLGFIGILVLVSDVVVGGAAPAVVGVLAAAVIAGLWFVLPLARRGEE